MTILSKKKLPSCQEKESEGQPIVSSTRSTSQTAALYEDNSIPGSSSPHYENNESSSKQMKRRHRLSPPRYTERANRRKYTNWREDNDEQSHATPGPSNEEFVDYNSGDEYDSPMKSSRPAHELQEEDRLFEKMIHEKGFAIKKMCEDGACLFRSVADQLFGDQSSHRTVRNACMDYIALKSDFFQQYVTEDINEYVDRKRNDRTHGNHVELQAIAEVYGRSIEVYCYNKDTLILQGNHKSDAEPIRISYHRGCHYNSLIGPSKMNNPLPSTSLPSTSVKPMGAAEDTILKDAIRKSEDLDIEKAIVDNHLEDTDREETLKVIEDQIARESLREFVQEQATALTSETQAEGDLVERLAPSLYELCGESGVLASVLALSTQEYFDNLKKDETNVD